jgi:hypothetical protein
MLQLIPLMSYPASLISIHFENIQESIIYNAHIEKKQMLYQQNEID